MSKKSDINASEIEALQKAIAYLRRHTQSIYDSKFENLREYLDGTLGIMVEPRLKSRRGRQASEDVGASAGEDGEDVDDGDSMDAATVELLDDCIDKLTFREALLHSQPLLLFRQYLTVDLGGILPPLLESKKARTASERVTEEEQQGLSAEDEALAAQLKAKA